MAAPKIRFKGFTNDWEQRKLGDVAKFRQGIQVDLEKQYTEFADGRERFIRIVDYTQGTDDIRYIDEVESANHVDVDDVVVVRYGATAGFVGHGITGIIANNMFTINPSDSINKDFLYTFMKQEKMYESLNSSNGSSAMPAINFGIMSNIRISYPSIEEQTRIGDYFSNFDNLITLHQRKCDDTKKLKKYMLSKMFPKNGLKRPEIRFEGFTDDWEQRKLGEVFEEYSEKKHEELPPLTIIQGGGTILREESDRALQYDKNSLSGYKIVKKNDFIVHLRSFEGGLEKANSDGIISPAYHTFHGDNTDSRFYYPFFRSRRFIDVLLKPHVYGIRDGKSIDIEGMKTIMIPVPAFAEQKKIGEYIESLDNLITLHQRKCDTLKELKKYILQNMFV